MSRLAEMLRRARRCGHEEGGAVIIIVAGCLTLFLALGAYTIDLGSQRQARQQAQSAADAASLAGAQVIPSGAAAVTSTSQQVATGNFPGADTASVSMPDDSHVKVIVNAPSQRTLGSLFGSANPRVSASAVAARTVSVCSTDCYAIFAMDSSCSTTNPPIQISGGNLTITGGILSNGSVSASGGASNTYAGTAQYGPGMGCSWPQGGGHYNSTPTRETALTTTWPIDYRVDFPACGTGTGTVCTGPCDNGASTCTSADKVPSFCTWASTSTPLSLTPTSGNIYCDVGTGVPADPSTWNGALAVGSVSAEVKATYVAGTVSFNGANANSTFTACGYSATQGYTTQGSTGCGANVPVPSTANYPLVYAVGTGSAITAGGGNANYNGDLFAPNGTITYSGGGATTSFLEGFDVVFQGGGLKGDGPSDTGSGAANADTESLVQ